MELHELVERIERWKARQQQEGGSVGVSHDGIGAMSTDEQTATPPELPSNEEMPLDEASEEMAEAEIPVDAVEDEVASEESDIEETVDIPVDEDLSDSTQEIDPEDMNDEEEE